MNVDEKSILAVVNIALLGAVTTNLRRVSVKVENGHFSLNFYYYQPHSEDEQESIYIVETEICSEYSLNEFDINLSFNPNLPENELVLFQKYERDYKNFRYPLNSFYQNEIPLALTFLNIRVSACHAILGRVTDNVRKISFNFSGNEIFLDFIYNTPPSILEKELERESIQLITQDFSKEVKITTVSKHIPVPLPRPKNYGIYSKADSEFEKFTN